MNDDYGTGFGAADIPSTTYPLTNASESALLLVLPPGPYSTVVSGVGDTTGVALTEVYEVRPIVGSTVLAQSSPVRGRLRLRAEVPPQPVPAGPKLPVELCVSAPLAVAGRP